jgi:GT2 family glycosyltransferase
MILSASLPTLNIYDTAIVLVNYNSIDDTNSCIKSIQDNTTSETPFIVVLDNASKDGPDFENKIVFYPNLKILKTEQNIGFGRANNLAINWIFENISCQYIFILNNDTILTKSLIEELKNGHVNGPNSIAVTSPKIMVYSNPDEIWYDGGLINLGKMSPVINKNYYSENFKPTVTDFASGCAMFFKADILKKLKGFDPFYFMYDEDVELSLSIKREGYEILYIPTATLYHKCQGSQEKNDNNTLPENQLDPSHPSLIFYLKNTIQNRLYTLNKHLNKDKIKVYFLFYLYWLLKAAQYLVNGKFLAVKIVLKALIDRRK